MEKFIVDASFPEKFRSITEPVYLCDASGSIVAEFQPVSQPGRSSEAEL